MGAPTLIVGIGGIGGSIVQKISDRAAHEKIDNYELVVMDTDVNDLRVIKERYPNIYTVQTSPKGTVGKALDHNHYARDRWFPVNDGLMGKPFTEGAGQVRAVSRLAFDHAVEQGLMENLEKAIAKLHGLTGDTMRQEMRIVIVGSIAGGTGSGLVLPVGMYIRNFLITRYQDSSAIIRGFFLQPDVVFGRIVDEGERNTQRANAYAAVRELNAFFRKEYSGESERFNHIVFNAPQPGLGERVDYPNILPYNYVFLMDALNENGDSLHDAEGRFDLEGYKSHAADCIYAMSLSPVASRMNSSEDNMVRSVTASGGLSRYCGAGSSCLEYPKERVQRYIALKWAEKNISGEWLEIDDEFNRLSREDPELDLSRFYRAEYEGKRGSNSPFYKAIMRRSERKGKDGEIVDRAERFVEALELHAKEWAKNDLYSQSQVMRRARYDSLDNDRFARDLPQDADVILESCNETDDPSGLMNSRLVSFFDAARELSHTAQEEVADLARGAAHSKFSISDYEDDPLGHRDKEWQLEKVFCDKGEDGVSGSFHPAAVRFDLYRVIEKLEQQKKDAEDAADAAKKQMNRAEEDDYYEGNEESNDVASAVGLIFSSDDSGRKKLRIPILKGAGGAIGQEEAEQLSEISAKMNKFKKRIFVYIENTVLCEFYEAALAYAKGLSAAYEAFYKHLRKELDGIRTELSAIEDDPALNNSKGRSHRYVCASRECLAAMLERCHMRGSSGDLPPELCGGIYASLLRFSGKNSAIKDYADRNKVTSVLFDGLFQEVVVDYWMNRVLDPRVGYPEVIDKGIVAAIADEALYRSAGAGAEIFLDQDAEARAVQSYIERALAEARHLSSAFIEVPVDESARPIRACAYAADAFYGAPAHADAVRQLLANSYNGTMVKAGEFSKYEIQFFSSLYGLCAARLPKYAPEHCGMENRPEGEYHRAYFAAVNQLSPNLKENRLITPHIDKNWHLINCLPDLDPDNESRIQHDTVRAYLFSLIFRQLGSEKKADADDVYYLKATKGRTRTCLWTSNGTPCDRFYEVFDALKFSPPVVSALLEASERRLRMERNKNMSLSIGKSDLVANIRSMAFGRQYDPERWISRIREGVANPEVLQDRDLQALTSRFAGGRIDSTVVVNLFFFGTEEEGAGRTSIFDIPLLYRVSLPQTEVREGEIDSMISSIFRTVEDHLRSFCSEEELIAECCKLFEEQYLRFEWNLIGYNSVFPGVSSNQVVGSVREKVLSYLEDAESSRAARIDAFQPTIQRDWSRRDEGAN